MNILAKQAYTAQLPFLDRPARAYEQRHLLSIIGPQLSALPSTLENESLLGQPVGIATVNDGAEEMGCAR